MQTTTAPACELCAGLTTVRYTRAITELPQPFCSRCGRKLAAVFVEWVPTTPR